MTPRILATVVLIGILQLSAQVPSTPSGAATKVARNVAARNDAIEFFKAGNAQGGLAALRGGVKTGARAPTEDVQVAGELCSVARILASTQHPAGPAIAALAAGELAKARAGASGRDAVYLDAQAGELHETILGDGVKARLFYQAALARDPRHKEALAGLNRIARLGALLQAKARENTELRSGAK